MDDLAKQDKQGAHGVQSGDKKRHNQVTNLDRQCPDCGVYPGQIHDPDCECLDETTERNEQ